MWIKCCPRCKSVLTFIHEVGPFSTGARIWREPLSIFKRMLRIKVFWDILMKKKQILDFKKYIKEKRYGRKNKKYYV